MPKVQQIAGNGGRGRRGRGARVGTSLAEINVVPLVDVMLVLLIIFMVTAPMMTQGLAVNLPQAKHSAPPVITPIYVTIPASFPHDHIVQIGDDPVHVEVLSERIKQALLERTDKNVFVRADASLSVQDLYTVWDKLKDANVEKVAMGAKPLTK